MAERSFELHRCLAFILAPLVNVGRVFGLDFVIPCPCIQNERTKSKKLFSSIFEIYNNGIEIFLWLTVLFSFMKIYDPNTYALRVGHLFNEHNVEASVGNLFLSIFIAGQFSILKRKKISLHFLKSSYSEEWKVMDQIQIYIFGFLINLFGTLMILSLVLEIVIYPEIKRQNGTNTEAFISTVFYSIRYFYSCGQILSSVLLSFVLLNLLGRRFNKLTEELEELKSERRFLKENLQKIIEKHSEMREIFEMINENWKELICLIYTYYMYGTCILLYAAIFVRMELKLRIGFLLFAMVFLTGMISCGWGMSFFVSLVYDNFLAIQRFSNEEFSLEFKFKIVNFMKRFGKIPMGVSVGGFFYVKRSFLIRMVSGLYSIFSSFVQVSGVMKHEKKCIEKNLKFNETYILRAP